jgi:hypothetical protein
MKESSSNPIEIVQEKKVKNDNSNLEKQIQEILDNNLAIKNNSNINNTDFGIPTGANIKIDYLAWFIQLLIWNIIVIIVNLFILQK